MEASTHDATRTLNMASTEAKSVKPVETIRHRCPYPPSATKQAASEYGQCMFYYPVNTVYGVLRQNRGADLPYFAYGHLETLSYRDIDV